MPANRRILHLIPSFGGGGAETQLVYLSEGLVNRGWHVDLLSLTGGPHLERARSSGAAIHNISARGNYDPSILWNLRRAVRQLAPDLVQTWLPMMDILGGCVARYCHVPWLLSERSSPSMFPSTLKLRVRVRLARRAAAVISNSLGGDEYWASILPAGVLRAVIRNALPLDDIDRSQPAPEIGFGLDDSRPLILYIGRFHVDKNVSNLADALARVVAQSDAVALLCGIGPELEPIRERLRELEIGDRVVAPGFILNMYPLIKRAAFAISLSRYEGMPNSVMEVAAAGCPLILSDIPAHRELLDDASAAFVDVDSVSSAAEAMLSVLRDPRPAAQRAASARERSRAWSTARVALEYERVYERVLARSRSRR